MERLQIRPLALRDISSSAEYLEDNGGLDLAERFLIAVRSEFDSLLKMPRIGVLCGFNQEAARTIRRWPIAGFENWMIFYKPHASGVEVVRVLHGAQDIRAVFD